MDPALDVIKKNLGEAAKRPLLPNEVQELAEEVLDLREYLKTIREKYPEVSRDFDPTIKVCNWLLSTD